MAGSQETRDFVARLARSAFTAGVRAASLTPSERDRLSVTVQQTAQDMLAGFVEAAVEQRRQEDVACGRG